MLFNIFIKHFYETLNLNLNINDFFFRNICSSRKRRTSYTQDEREFLLNNINDDQMMTECNAALVLMSLSCSPNSPKQGTKQFAKIKCNFC